MSMHNKPLTSLEESGLKAHGLDIGEPSQLSDCFRHGLAWALSELSKQECIYQVRDEFDAAWTDTSKGHYEIRKRSGEPCRIVYAQPVSPSAEQPQNNSALIKEIISRITHHVLGEDSEDHISIELPVLRGILNDCIVAQNWTESPLISTSSKTTEYSPYYEGTTGTLWHEKQSENELLESTDVAFLQKAIFNLFEDLRCLKEFKNGQVYNPQHNDHVFIVDHCGSTFGIYPEDSSTIVGSQLKRELLQKGTKLYLQPTTDDSVRLNWMISKGAFISWGKDGEKCAVYNRGDDEFNELNRLNQNQSFREPREAIDHAIKLHQERELK